MGRKGSHSEQFRLEACKLVSEQGYSIIEAAKQLDVPYNTLWNWLARYGPRLSTSQESDQQTSDDPGLLKNRIRELEKQVHRLEMEKEILKKATAYLAGADMTFAWIHENRRLWPAAVQCQTLEVTRGGFYAWSMRQATGKASPRLERHRQLTQQVRLSYVRSRGNVWRSTHHRAAQGTRDRGLREYGGQNPAGMRAASETPKAVHSPHDSLGSRTARGAESA